MPTYKLTLEYEGTRYRGWQEQTNARSVAGEVKRAIAEAMGEGNGLRELGGAGRTDAGVHALAQVAHLRLARAVDPEPFRWAVNELLPPDVHLLSCAAVPDRFHARHDAAARSYLYQVSRRRTALAKRFVWWVKRPLDASKMAEAAALVPGRHDFRLFCERPGEQPGTVVVVERAEIVEAGGLVLFRITASHFLWKMVRRLTGTLVRVGAGELSVAGFTDLVDGALARKAPRAGAELPAQWTAPPSGLFLERVLYPGDSPLPTLAADSAAVPVAAER